MGVTNFAYSLGKDSTGWSGHVPGYSTPDRLDKVDSFTTSRNGQVIEGIECTGDFVIKHDDVEVVKSKGRGADIADGKKGTQFLASEFGAINGHKPRLRQECIRGGDYLLWHCNVYGFIDLFRPKYGEVRVVRNWLHSLYLDPTGFSGGLAHCDPFQPLNNAFDLLLIQENRLDIWPFPEGGTAGGQYFGNLSVKPATSGIILAEYGKSKNIIVRGTYSTGNFAQWMYIINGDDNTDPNPPMGTAVFDNIIERVGGRKFFGATAFCNFGGVKKPYPTVIWGRNVEAATGLELPPNYKDAPNAGQIIKAGPSDSFPYYVHQGGQVETPMIEIPSSLLVDLRGDFTAIRNNSRSTEGDPWQRLKGNVGRAELGISRIEDVLEKVG